MILAIDIGNTTMNFGFVSGEGTDWEVVASGRVETGTGDPETAVEQLLACLQETLAAEDAEMPLPEGAVLSSVVPAVVPAVRRAVADVFGLDVLVVDRMTDTGLAFDRVDTSTLGHDRLVDASFAAACLPLPVMTVDLGTATTINVVGEGRVFLGGLICAGIGTGLTALHEKTAQLPALEAVRPAGLIGENTVQCMLSGAVNGTAAMIDGLTDRVGQALGRPVSLLVTGGKAPLILPYLTHPCAYEPQLMLKGLACIYSRGM